MKYTLFLSMLVLFYQPTFAQDQKQTRKETLSNEPVGIDPGIVPNNGKVNPPPPTSVFMYVEQMPSPTYDMNSYLQNNLHYPEAAKKDGVQGRVIIQFVVNEDGSISDASVVRSLGEGCDEEALRVIKKMPAWKPGKQNGKAVKVRFTQPVSFMLK